MYRETRLGLGCWRKAVEEVEDAINMCGIGTLHSQEQTMGPVWVIVVLYGLTQRIFVDNQLWCRIFFEVFF